MRSVAAVIGLIYSQRCSALQAPAKAPRSVFEAVRPHLPSSDTRRQPPNESLARGEWFKLICGASFEDLAAVRNLSLVYTLAGVDCIDVAAEGAVLSAAREGIVAGTGIAADCGASLRPPWLMMSINDDDKDPHFRKAVFDAEMCPDDCPRPCEKICPAAAIDFPASSIAHNHRGTGLHETQPVGSGGAAVAEMLAHHPLGGVIAERCYGCGRCIDVCPPGIIGAVPYVRKASDIIPLLERVEAIEIHTKGDLNRFKELWSELKHEAAPALRAVAGGVFLNIWQTDGRPMSGDIGSGAAAASVAFSGKVLEGRALPYGVLGKGGHYVQLAGGTNDTTAKRLKELKQRLVQEGKTDLVKGIGGVAIGGYARKVVNTILERLPEGCVNVENDLSVLRDALIEARKLVATVKGL